MRIEPLNIQESTKDDNRNIQKLMKTISNPYFTALISHAIVGHPKRNWV
jgi:hypothetical protein